MGLAKTLLTPWRLAAVISMSAAPTIAAAQSAPTPSGSAPPPAASDSTSAPPGATAGAPPAASNAPAGPAYPAPATAPPPPPGYTPPAYVGPYAQPAYPPAQEPPLPPEPPPDNRTVSLTLSPVHLLIGPILEVEGEYRVAEHFGFALIGGYGKVKTDTIDSTGATRSTSFTAGEIGAQLNVYPLKPFKGLDLAAELMYLKIGTDSVADTQFSGIGVGLAVGPLIGYKVMTDGGFTFVVQGGVSYMVVKAEVKDPSGAQASQNDSAWLPNLNLNIGWSF